MKAYRTRKCIHRKLDKYMEENRTSDHIAALLTKILPSLILMSFSNGSKFTDRNKKAIVISGCTKTDEQFQEIEQMCRAADRQIQTCAKCFRPCDRRTRRDRYKVCHQCIPNTANTTIGKHLDLELKFQTITIVTFCYLVLFAIATLKMTNYFVG